MKLLLSTVGIVSGILSLALLLICNTLEARSISPRKDQLVTCCLILMVILALTAIATIFAVKLFFGAMP